MYFNKFKFNNHSGSSIIEYIIPLALVGVVVGLGMFYLFSSGGLNNFFKSSMNASDNNNTFVLDKNSSETPLVSETNRKTSSGNNPGGSINDPNAHCNGSECTIDFGDYVISGIPANFSEYVESAATSGGTDKLASLLKELANNANIDVATRNLILDLANKGHSMARLEECLEEKVAAADPNTFSPDKEFNLLSNSLTTGQVYKDFNSLFNQIKNSLSASPTEQNTTTLAVVDILASEIMSLANNMKDNTDKFTTITGENTDTLNDKIIDVLNNITSPNYSGITDLDSALICASGHGKDAGLNCK